MDPSRDEGLAEFAWQATQSGGLSETAAMIVEFARLAVRADTARITLIRAGGALASIGQTDDTVAEAHDVTSSDLATYSQQTNTKLRVFANDVIIRRGLPVTPVSSTSRTGSLVRRRHGDQFGVELRMNAGSLLAIGTRMNEDRDLPQAGGPSAPSVCGGHLLVEQPAGWRARSKEMA